MKGIGHSPTSILQRKNGVCIDKSPACHNNASFCPQFVIFRLEKNAMAKTKAEEKLSTLIRFCLTAGIICALRATPARSLKSVISPAVQPRSSQKVIEQVENFEENN